MAGLLGKKQDLQGDGGHEIRAVKAALRAGHVPLSLRPGTPRGASRRLHCHRHLLPLPENAGLQRIAPHGIRCLRPACRELRHQDGNPSRHHHQRQHRALHPADQGPGLFLRLGPLRLHLHPGLLPLDPVDFPSIVQEGPCLRGRDSHQLVSQLPHGPCQRGGEGGPLRPLRHRRHQKDHPPVDSENHRLCRASAG